MSATPACIATMLETWNTPDPAARRAKAEAALVADAEFVDPHYDIRGVEAFLAMVEAFQGKYPNARIERTSGRSPACSRSKSALHAMPRQPSWHRICPQMPPMRIICGCFFSSSAASSSTG